MPKARILNTGVAVVNLTDEENNLLVVFIPDTDDAFESLSHTPVAIIHVPGGVWLFEKALPDEEKERLWRERCD